MAYSWKITNKLYASAQTVKSRICAGVVHPPSCLLCEWISTLLPLACPACYLPLCDFNPPSLIRVPPFLHS
jgi:hypothetical protein